MKRATDLLDGTWKELRGALMQDWADSADDDLKAMEDAWERLIGLLQAKYCFGRAEAKRRLLDLLAQHQ